MVEASLATVRANVVLGDTEVLRAGGGVYDTPWTRDASLNSWLAVSQLDPGLARETLLAVTEEVDGVRLVAQDDQWWDQMLWAVAAEHHYRVSADVDFLTEAYGIAARSMAVRERDSLVDGLFRGPAVMQDGASGYPTELLDPSLLHESFVLLHPRLPHVVTLSTNLAHVAAYDALAAMAHALDLDPAPHREAADALRNEVERVFWSDEPGSYSFLVEPATGERYDHEEALGVALAVLTGAAGPRRAQMILRRLHRSAHGVVNLWPHLVGYDDELPGRHNAMCWPMVMGMCAWAGAVAGDVDTFGADLARLSRLLGSADGQFELYDAVTGGVHGGWQAGRSWRSEPDQTWSATALLGAVLHGLVGLRPGTGGLRFAPVVPADLDGAVLTGLPYRGAVLEVSTSGSGAHLVEVRVDGAAVPVDAPVHVAGSATGRVLVELRCAQTQGET